MTTDSPNEQAYAIPMPVVPSSQSNLILMVTRKIDQKSYPDSG